MRATGSIAMSDIIRLRLGAASLHLMRVPCWVFIARRSQQATAVTQRSQILLYKPSQFNRISGGI